MIALRVTQVSAIRLDHGGGASATGILHDMIVTTRAFGLHIINQSQKDLLKRV